MAKTTEERLYRGGPMRAVWPSPSRPARRRAARRADADYGVPAEPGWREVDWPAHTHRMDIRGRSVKLRDVWQSAHAAPSWPRWTS